MMLHCNIAAAGGNAGRRLGRKRKRKCKRKREIEIDLDIDIDCGDFAGGRRRWTVWPGAASG